MNWLQREARNSSFSESRTPAIQSSVSRIEPLTLSRRDLPASSGLQVLNNYHLTQRSLTAGVNESRRGVNISAFSRRGGPETSARGKRGGGLLEASVTRSARVDRSSAAEHVICFCENRAREIGFAAFSSFTGRVTVGSVPDNSLYERVGQLLLQFRTFEVCVSESPTQAALAQALDAAAAGGSGSGSIIVRRLATKSFAEDKGALIWRSLRRRGLPELRPDGDYLALASFSALASLFGPAADLDSLEVVLYNPEEFLQVNPAGLRDLGLLHGQGSKHALTDAFRPLTPGGARALRAALVAAPADPAAVRRRGDAAAALRACPAAAAGLARHLPTLSAAETLPLRMLAPPGQNPQRLFRLLADVAEVVAGFCRLSEELPPKDEGLRAWGAIPGVHRRAEELSLKNDELKGWGVFSPELRRSGEEVRALVEGKLSSDPIGSGKHGYVFLLRQGAGVAVDLARHSYARIYAGLTSLFEDYRLLLRDAGLGELRLSEAAGRPPRLRLRPPAPLTTMMADDLPRRVGLALGEAILGFTSSTRGASFSTPAFSTLALRLDRCADMILDGTFEAGLSLLATLRPRTAFFSSLAHEVASADLILAFAGFGKDRRGFTAPSLLGSFAPCLRLSAAQPPEAAASAAPRVEPTPLDFFFPAPETQGLLAPPRTGKSTALRTLGRAVVLAQNGCLLPCKAATLPVFSRLFAAFTPREPPESGGSAFASELAGLNQLFSSLKAGRTTLCLLDSPFSRTNPSMISEFFHGLLNQLASHPSAFALIAFSDPSIVPLFEQRRFPILGITNFSLCPLPPLHPSLYSELKPCLSNKGSKFEKVLIDQVQLVEKRFEHRLVEGKLIVGVRKLAMLFCDFAEGSISETQLKELYSKLSQDLKESQLIEYS